MLAKKTQITLPAVFWSTLLLNAGAAFMWPLTTVYMNQMLGKSLTLAGSVLLVTSLMMMVGNFVGGWLFDRWSPYGTGLVGAGMSLIAMLVLIRWHAWPTFAIMLFVVGFGDGISLTVGNSFAATITHKTTRQVFNVLYIGLNVGVVIGTLLVGYLLDFGITTVFAVTTVCYIALFAIMAIAFRVEISTNQAEKETATKVPGANLRVIWLLCLLVFTLYASYALWESVLSVHMTNLHIPFRNYSLLWTLNGILIVVGQPIMNRLFASRKLATQIGLGSAIFALSFFLLIFASQYAVFVVIMIILTFGEMIGFPGMPAWVDALAEGGQKGKYQGMYNVAISLGRAVGPLFGGLMIDDFSYQALFLTVTVAMLLALGLVLLGNTRLRRRSVK
ncbi:MDR family MFS transporter [Secundilactobacillus similis]|uniref:Major facilitator superfamily protein n=1 Tax=Secundilactobacillus similis DSM 23365 = JCM 2765 TaxID=1423804 RepID=A0A0R2F4R4_9LACO|nr:MFS transporter [Secundilactobacillus similis]KRN23251.1 major facilitator superfamily protein [Secundilactobacillus similis DSM 23365 = JCM 2765]